MNVGLVRQLYGTVEADRVTAGIMVTNSYFSKDARRFQQTIKSRMNLMDYSELMKQIMDCSRKLIIIEGEWRHCYGSIIQ